MEFPFKVNLGIKKKKKTEVEEKIHPLPFGKSESVGLESGKMGKTGTCHGNRTAAGQESSQEQGYEVGFMLMDSEDNKC